MTMARFEEPDNIDPKTLSQCFYCEEDLVEGKEMRKASKLLINLVKMKDCETGSSDIRIGYENT